MGTNSTDTLQHLVESFPVKVEAKVKEKEKEKSQQLKEEPIDQDFNNEEEEKDAPLNIFPGPPIIHAIPMTNQFPNALDQLKNMKDEAKSISCSLSSEKPGYKRFIDSDPQFEYYWNSLEKCAKSLEGIISDVYYIHANSTPVQTHYIPQPIYYPQDQLRPRYIGPPFYHERPPGTEF